ncbi:RdgB/HAM1 family non-canonical purine NTP pyrophosphatase [Zhongshania aquimaris]|uniref:dITP/XTP pyrophosphatase n=1 Tax=Zhongshania aquimaris TaxID=2857107 RepID=A0ABS6VSH1_9GAMM|nr:RdgB/HAM1 family non-canonical purine NTP pyrophosphatase [Zhongshania aquimaris]MBW2941262.1 RdgB/HAM1 family non-canonical purine NTP pyrophosphatase [Zhongshania aquimaris]
MTTTPSFAENTVVLASGNRGKLRELSDLLNGLGITLRSQADFDVVEAEENGLSFIENAILKARNAARQTGFAALADDSGLCVDALGGAPGIYSARYAGANAQDADNNTKLLETLKAHSNRGAHFHCALAFVRHADDPAPLVCEGQWHGEILSAPRGDNGFGYDPLFYIASLDCCSAELSKEQKNKISHRALALQQLLPRLRTEYLGA